MPIAFRAYKPLSAVKADAALDGDRDGTAKGGVTRTPPLMNDFINKTAVVQYRWRVRHDCVSDTRLSISMQSIAAPSSFSS